MVIMGMLKDVKIDIVRLRQDSFHMLEESEPRETPKLWQIL